MSAIKTIALGRRFGAVTAVKDLTIAIPSGGVTGLVGPNGSGKSTLIRMLLGLIRPTAGDATVLGSSIREPARYAARVGALVDSPAYHPGLSARANLGTIARLRGLPLARVEAVLDQVGLTGRDNEAVKRFSLGMRQRLAIAMALLPEPELLLLDEPTNGLDPAGIVEMRSMLRDLGQNGRTVVVSSHQLNEIQAICDHLVFLRHGEALFAGPMRDLLATGGGHLEIRAERPTDHATLAAALAADGWPVTALDAGLRVEATPDRAADINRAAAAAGVTLAHLVAEVDDLERVFLSMTEPSTEVAA